MKVLRIDSSLNGAAGYSSQLSAQLSQELLNNHGGDEIHHQLADSQHGHFNAATIAAIGRNEAAIADQYINELQQADVLIIGAPMYNFGISSQLKTWIDYVARAGRTFEYTSAGPKGLLRNKKVYVISSRGGQHQGQESDLVTPYLRQVLGFLGLNDVEFIYAEGLAMRDHKALAIEHAQAHIQQIIERQAA